jgi:zinc-ribbon domain/Sel1 repeat
VRCPRCGNENSDANRFCGMCGTTLLPVAAPVAAATAQTAAARSSTLPSPAPAASAQPQNPTLPRTSSVTDDAPVISGPSFLGLNQPAPRKRASLSISPDAAPSSSNLDYLLEDEEEPRHGGGAKFILILLALALAVGLGYLRWKNHGFPWLSSSASKPSAAAQNSDATDTSSTTPPASTTSTTPAAAQPAADPAAGPPAASSTTNPVTATAPSSAPPATADATPASGAANSPADPATAPPVPAAKEPAPAATDTPPAPSPKAHKAADAPTLKPRAGIMAAKPADPVAEAQKYLYGRGVTQDCDRGLRLLKPAANQSNPKAMIEMGALYSAGLCTPHDLPTAYRWFALALRKDPDNQAVQTDLQKLWGEMTQPERQLAIKLSQ